MSGKDTSIPAILLALGISIAPQLFNLSGWIILWCGFLWGYAYLADRYELKLPGNLVKKLLTLGGIAGVLLSFGRTLDGDAYISLLAIMSGLKMIEVRNHRDRMVTVFLAYFIVITSLFQSENLAITLYMFLSVTVTTAVLIHINHPGGKFKKHIGYATKIVLQALPLMAILFFLFPRIQGSFWRYSGTAEGTTGFSDEMRPGSISRLVKNDEIAFRVQFDGPVPERQLLYWRGIVFWHFNGAMWRRGLNPGLGHAPEKTSSPVQYAVMLEPHNKRWLFSLDLPGWAPSGARLLDDFTIKTRRLVRNLYRYRMKSYLDYNTDSQIRFQKAALQLPRYGNPQTRELVNQWRQRARSPEEIVKMALDYFKENNFKYTLQPAMLHNNPVDGILFETRQGYCEHYASAFAFLMRAAGIPARVVGGYLGGEYNPIGNYLIVRQSDAHAWVELWLSGQGWVRVDPTAAVSPTRVNQGVAQALSHEIPAFLDLDSRGPLGRFWKNIRLSWDAVNSLWDIWFVGYSQLEQRDFLSKIGIDILTLRGLIEVILLCLLLIGGFVLVMVFFHYRKFRPKTDPVLENYQLFCRKLARIGMPKKPYQGPTEYAASIAAVRKDLQRQVEKITEKYVLLRYAPVDEHKMQRELKEFDSRIKNFDPKKLHGAQKPMGE